LLNARSGVIGVTPKGKIGSWICGIGSDPFGREISKLDALRCAEAGTFAKSQPLPKAARHNRCARLAFY